MALDAPQHLQHVLDHFFSQKQNKYKYALAHKHFNNVKSQDTFVDANCFFKILTGTNLITKKHVLHYLTAQGMRYLIKKDYAQSFQRDLRNTRRTHQKKPDTSNEQVVSHTPSPFVQLMTNKTPIDDSSSDESLHPQDHQQKTPEKVPGVDLTDPESQQEDSNLHTKMENLIDQAIQCHIDKLLS